ncbi:MAG TPA: S-layer homology domain-containing protein [Defluviitoga sp.]|nr:S-layer homology domain-containing protein [Defluviitoga sp.]HOP24272.1 S-layer homology domain-containing protein [Defluviitoga sp.]HPZ28136.1 S-layer homology domain-containing protein [Defluviitoga sp.]HQD62026.1 S-layer homology domain-containing protein [Defluviitoga sp.]
MKKVGILFLVVILSVGLFSQTFKDVPINHWAYDAVERLSKIGVIEGYPDGTFKGLENMNRYQLTVALSRTIDYITQSVVGPVAQNVSNLEKKVNALSVPQGVSSAELQQIQSRLDSISSNVANLQSSVTRLDNSVKELQNSYELLGYTTTKITELERKIDSLTVPTPAVSKSDFDSLKLQVSQLQTSVKSLESNYQNLSLTTSQLQDEVKKISDVQSSLSKTNQEVEKINALVSNLNTKIDTKADATDVAQLKNDTQQLNTKINTNTQSITQLSSQLQVVQKNVTDLSQEVANVRKVAESASKGKGINFVDIIIAVVVSTGISFLIYNLMPANGS